MEIAYDGTAYCGFQIQNNAVTVEGVINEKLSQMTGEDIRIIGASRTDSGVHAKGNAAVFDTDSRIPGEKFAPALNTRLPEDIRIIYSKETEPDFHPRHCDCVKTYEYKIYNSPVPDPLLRLYSHFEYIPLDVEAMREGTAYLVGEHDFKSFCSIDTSAKTTVRTIYSIEVSREDNLITIRIKGNGFLYNMVRIIAGTLMLCGKGRLAPEKIREILASKDREKAGPTAPAKGLTLVKIDY